MKINAIATQGRQGVAQWVTSYYIKHSLNGENFAIKRHWYSSVNVSTQTPLG